MVSDNKKFELRIMVKRCETGSSSGICFKFNTEEEAGELFKKVERYAQDENIKKYNPKLYQKIKNTRGDE